jgi:hypothetical protein
VEVHVLDGVHLVVLLVEVLHHHLRHGVLSLSVQPFTDPVRPVT